MISSERPLVPIYEGLSAGSASTVPDSGKFGAPPGKSEWLCPKTRLRHLERQAAVYVRQSTPHQVVEHGESLARQYALRDRAMALGWPSPSVLVIDQDLGLSGSGSENRLGFQRLLAEVAQDRVGLVLALEISRLARNSRDWHNLFDLCAVRDVLLADEDGVYDPGDINDRLILGMKGIMSELELHIMKGRLERGRRNKAQRGELFHSVPWGYVLQPDVTVAFDPDEQVRATVRRLFGAFQRLGSAFAVVRELRREDVKLPMRDGNGLLGWRVATATIVQTALHHPLYAGAYSWGRRQTQSHVDPSGRITRRRRHRAPADWSVLLHDRAPAYISWEQYLANQRQLLENLRRPASKGAPGGGSALLTGLVYCGRCGRKMYVSYQTIRLGRYCCSRAARFAPTDDVCSGLPAHAVDKLVSRQLLQTLSPAGIELSLNAIEHTSQQRQQRALQLRQNLERATYEANRAERQFHAVEPENRLVARTVEARWEAALQQQRAAGEALEAFQRAKPIELTIAERRSLEELSRDIPALWDAPETTARQRQEIVRCLIERVAITVRPAEQTVDVLIRWEGGFESRHNLRRPVFAYEQLDDFDRLCDRLGELRRAGWRSPRIAAQLNAEGFQTPKQRGVFTADLVRFLCRSNTRVRGRDGTDLQPPEWSADALAARLKIPVKKLKDWVRCGRVRAVARPFGGTWILHADEGELNRLERRAAFGSKGRHSPPELDQEAV
jgi:DNA invertase Pin-like site-specific DNA recombinase